MNHANPTLLSDEQLDTVNRGLRLIRKKQGLTFGTDSFLLAAYMRPMPRARAVELGGGTGIVSLLAANCNKAASITAIELQPAFASLIERNAALNGYSDRIRSLCADIREVRAEDVGGEVDLVFSNPPYMRCDSGRPNEREEKYIARHETAGDIADFCAAAARLLRYGGRFVSVWRPDRLPELLYALHAVHIEPKRMTLVHSDRNAEPCMVLTEAVKGASPALRMTPPLLLYRERLQNEANRVLTPEAELIYERCLFPDILSGNCV